MSAPDRTPNKVAIPPKNRPVLKASDCSFQEMRTISCSLPDLAILLSYFQVEYGLAHTESLWNIYTEIANCDEEVFTTKNHICKQFSEALSDYREIESSEPPSYKMGSPLDSAS
jgi:hypothetical protein